MLCGWDGVTVAAGLLCGAGGLDGWVEEVGVGGGDDDDNYLFSLKQLLPSTEHI